MLGGEFIAAAQMIVYAGAIMVLFVFVIMLLNAGAETRRPGLGLRADISACSLLAAFLGMISFVIQAHVAADAKASTFGAFRRAGRRVGRRIGSLFTDLPAALRSHLGPDPDRHRRRDRSGAEGDLTMPP